MRIEPSFDPSATTQGEINVSAVDPGAKILLYNLSVVALRLNFNNGNTAILHAGEANYWTLDGTTPTIEWSQGSILNATAALSEVTVTVYGTDEKLDGVYPMSLMYQLNIGNTITANMGNVASVQNDGGPANTQFIEATQSGSPSSNVSFDNSGNSFIAQTVGGIVTKLFETLANAPTCVKIGAASKLAEVLGNLKIDGTLESAGSATLDGTLEIKGAATLDSTMEVKGAATLDGTMEVKGAATMDSTLDLNIGSTTINGGTSGTAVHWMPLQGSALKLLLICESNFRTASSNQDYVLPTPFVNGCWFFCGSVVKWNFLSGGNIQSANVLTGLAAGGGTNSFQQDMNSYSIGNLPPTEPFDAIRHTALAGSAHTGWTLIIGN